ncbi:MAG: hypothetical protein AAF798_04680 [Bacteroidota bacterium]
MKKKILLLVLVFASWHLYAPPNCEIYKSNTTCYQSCQQAMKAIRYRQGSHQSQRRFEKSIALCPDFAYSYMEKAVPYLKRGLFIEWKAMIDKAVELSPKEYLGYRGWCRLQFLRDYQGAINDIQQLQSLVHYDIGYGQTGDYHLNFALALSYKGLGQLEQARQLMLQHLQSDNYTEGLYDYYHLGVVEYELGNFDQALHYLNRQVEVNDYMSDTYYYMALCNKQLNQREQYAAHLEKAEVYYRSGKTITDNYTEAFDKIYLTDILNEKNNN